MRKYFVLTIFISFLIALDSQINTYLVSGNLVFQKGDFLSNQKVVYDDLPSFTILAMKGKLKKPKNHNHVDVKTIKNYFFTTMTDPNGYFKFKLRSGIYTFFILKTDYIYSNIFDGNGYFKSYLIKSI